MSQIDITKHLTSPGMGRSGLPSLTSPLAADVSSLNPISLMRRFTDEMDRLFGSAMGRLRGDADFWMPALEMTEHDGHLMISAEVPGLRKEDMKVEITKDVLILEGERKRGHRERHDGFYQSERSYGRFYRAIPLPEGSNIDKAVAELMNGTLEVSIPIPETQANRRQIPVQEGKSRNMPPN